MKFETRPLFCLLATASLLLAACGQAMAQGNVAGAKAPTPAAYQPQLHGITLTEADGLILELRKLQEKLRRGETTYFDLLSGANPSFKAAGISPRQAFLDMDFKKPFSVERVATDSRLWRPFRLTYLGEGAPRLIWEVEVVLGIHGQIERVQMLSKPPAPF